MKKDEILNLELKAEEFIKTALSADAPQIQKDEMKKAFITGMIYGFKLATELPMVEDNEEKVMSLLFNYNNQLDILQQDLENGTIIYKGNKS